MARDARDFLFNSDYAQDQIVYFKEVALLNQTAFHTETIAHGLDFRPLVFGVWDNTDEYDSPKPVNSFGKDPFIENGIVYESNTCWVYSDSTNIYILTWPKQVASGSFVSTNYHIRLYAFEPPDSNASVKPTSNKASKFIFNTRYNYLKLKEQGMITADSGQVNIAHSLGYAPQVLAWSEVENSGYVSYVDSYMPPNFFVDNPAINVTKNLVTFDRYNNRSTKYYYRIYYDEA